MCPIEILYSDMGSRTQEIHQSNLGLVEIQKAIACRVSELALSVFLSVKVIFGKYVIFSAG